MEIHHYTSIENLALILKNKTFRFTRLDKVDDGEECNLKNEGLLLSYYTFVSCWTCQSEESIPLWKMYAGKDMHGVRLTFKNQDIFKKYAINSGVYRGVEIRANKGQEVIFPPEKMFNKDYLIVPSVNDSDMFFRKVIYVDEPAKEMKGAVELIKHDNGLADMTLDLKKIGTYKRLCWEFQKEYRFILTIIPQKTHKDEIETSIANYLIQSIYDKIPPSIDHYDLDIDSFSNMEITLSPTCSRAEEIIVRSLASLYASDAKIKPSSLSGIILK